MSDRDLFPQLLIPILISARTTSRPGAIPSAAISYGNFVSPPFRMFYPRYEYGILP